MTLVDRKKEGLIPFIEKRAGVKFERIGAPQPQEMARIAGVPWPLYMDQAEVGDDSCCENGITSLSALASSLSASAFRSIRRWHACPE